MASTKSEILQPLNPEQRKAGLHVGGIAAFIAGPGTGKTTAQVACAALKVLSGMEPRNIAMITFTNKAAGEMQERLVKHIDEDAYRVFVGTFHQLAIKKILRPNSNCDFMVNKGYSNGFNILDTSDQKVIVKEAKDQLNESETNQLEFAKVDEDFLRTLMTKQKAQGHDVRDVFSGIKNIENTRKLVQEFMPGNGLGDNKIKDFFANNYDARVYLGALWWERYEKICMSNAAMDFDDLLVNCSKLLQAHPEIRQKLGKTFLHLQIDEYQDTSPVQFQIVQSIIEAQTNPSAIAVGDMRQAIYGFRGADSSSMQTFVDTFGADVYPMNRNYRTAGESIAAINQFGETMANQLTDGNLLPMSVKSGPIPEIKHFKSDKDEAVFITEKIKELIADGESPSDIAVIYRAKAVNKEIMSLLDTDKVQYDVIGDVDFYDTKEVKIAISVLRLLVNENDKFALHKIMSEMPIGISKMKLSKESAKKQITQMQALKEFASNGSALAHKSKVLLDELDDISFYIPSYSDVELAAYNKLDIMEYRHRLNFDKSFQDTISHQVKQFAHDVAPMFAERIQKFFKEHVLHSFNNDTRKAVIKKYPDASEEEIENLIVEKLQERTDRVTKLTQIFSKTVEGGIPFKDAVDEIMLLADNTKNNKEASVKLMTGHAAKGLEFNKVFFVGAEQETFFRDEPNEVTMAEEERLLYVGVTRHRDQLIITHCDQRFVNGQFNHYTPLEFLPRFAGTVKSDDDYEKKTSSSINETQHASNSQTETPAKSVMPGPDASDLISKIQKKGRSSKTSNAESHPVKEKPKQEVPAWVNDDSDSDDFDDFKFMA